MNVFPLDPEEIKKPNFQFKFLGVLMAAFFTAWGGGYAARSFLLAEIVAIKKDASAEAHQKVSDLEKDFTAKQSSLETALATRAATRDREIDSMKKEYQTGIERIERKVDDLVTVVIERLPPKHRKVSSVKEPNDALN